MDTAMGRRGDAGAPFASPQIEGSPADYRAEEPEATEPKECIAAANHKADIREGGNRGPSTILEVTSFKCRPLPPSARPNITPTCSAYEAIHWTMHKDRLNRDLGFKKWEDEGYAREELAAEIGSAFLAADLSFAIEPREDHAAYVQGWHKAIKGDKRAIISAAAHAERAIAYLHYLQLQAVACANKALILAA